MKTHGDIEILVYFPILGFHLREVTMETISSGDKIHILISKRQLIPNLCFLETICDALENSFTNHIIT